MNDVSRLLTPDEAADYLRVSLRTLRRLSIPRVMVRSLVRYDLEDLKKWRDAQKVFTSDGETELRTRASHTKAMITLSPRAKEILEQRQRKQLASTSALSVVQGGRSR